jgi:tetratricopeptide (TPR) repeat protein
VPSGELVARALGDDLAEYVAFIDPGVEWMSDHLDTLKRALEDSPNALMAYSGTLKRVADTIVHTVFDGQFDAMEQIAELGDFTFRGNLLLRRALVRQIPPWLLGQFRWREALAYFTLAQARGRAVATLRQTATIIDGGGLFLAGSDEDRERETAILLELMPPEQLRLRQLYATTGVMRAPAPAAIYDVDRAPPAEIADLIDRAQSASAAPSVLASLRSATQIRKARAAARARDWSGAAAAYQRALRALPHQPKAWVQFGHALKEGGDRDAAEAAYREAVRLRPRSSDTHLQLGHLLKIQGRTAEAARHYRTALALDPRSREAGREAQLLGVA